MDKRLDKLDDRIERIENSLNSIDKTLVRNTNSLEYHIKRTDLLEKKLEPVSEHVQMMSGALKALGILSLIVGIIVGIIKIFG